jgi:hypothetical protein
MSVVFRDPFDNSLQLRAMVLVSSFSYRRHLGSTMP